MSVPDCPMIARDGEGATKFIEVQVTGAKQPKMQNKQQKLLYHPHL